MYWFGDRVWKRAAVGGLGVIAGALLAGCPQKQEAAKTAQGMAVPAMTAAEREYVAKVAPIVRESCYRCHAGMNRRSGFQMDTRAALLKGGKHGVAVVPGRPEESLLIRLVRHAGHAGDPQGMPLKGTLTDREILVLTQWVKDGVAMPACAEGAGRCTP